jgi:hypothetical protein
MYYVLKALPINTATNRTTVITTNKGDNSEETIDESQSDLIDLNRRIYFSLNTQQTSQNGFKLDQDSRKGVVIFFCISPIIPSRRRELLES